MSHVSRLSPVLRTALLGTSAAIALPAPAEPSNTSMLPAVHRFATDADALFDTVTRGIAAARSLIADPKPYRGLDTARLQGMVDAVAVIAESDTAALAGITLPAEAYDMLRECIRAERARCATRGEAWAISETIVRRAGPEMFAFSEARRRLAASTRVDPPGHLAFVGPDAVGSEA